MRTDPNRHLAALVAAMFLSLASLSARADIANTLHNLTPSGPGSVKNPDPVGMCRFCHTPHRAGQTTALWNRDLPNAMYDIYQSTTLEALPGQPTGTSRLCLSCHDGTLALGNVLHTGSEAVAPLGPLTGRVLLDTDLSDDHPISFVFDEALATVNGELVSPSTLTGPVSLDETGQVQCTSCHDPHSDLFPKFLVMSIESAALCVTCHDKRGWTDASHATSAATWTGFGEDPWPESSFSTVAQNGCLSCHDPHSAAHPERLLRRDPEEQVCLVCHAGNVAQTDVEMQLLKISAHPV
jgi:predicted CXXCH cytochrome family protein